MGGHPLERVKNRKKVVKGKMCLKNKKLVDHHIKKKTKTHTKKEYNA
jgi:hypothetical protein